MDEQESRAERRRQLNSVFKQVSARLNKKARRKLRQQYEKKSGQRSY